jgi:hypothetical protein
MKIRWGFRADFWVPLPIAIARSSVPFRNSLAAAFANSRFRPAYLTHITQ